VIQLELSTPKWVGCVVDKVALGHDLFFLALWLSPTTVSMLNSHIRPSTMDGKISVIDNTAKLNTKKRICQLKRLIHSCMSPAWPRLPCQAGRIVMSVAVYRCEKDMNLSLFFFFFLSIIIFRKNNWADCLSFDSHIIFTYLKNLFSRTNFGWNRTTLMDNVFENLHMLSTTLVTNATSIVTVTMLVRTSDPTVNMITHLTKVRMGVGTQTERTRTYYYDPQKFLTYFFIFLASRSFFSKPR